MSKPNVWGLILCADCRDKIGEFEYSWGQPATYVHNTLKHHRESTGCAAQKAALLPAVCMDCHVFLSPTPTTGTKQGEIWNQTIWPHAEEKHFDWLEYRQRTPEQVAAQDRVNKLLGKK